MKTRITLMLILLSLGKNVLLAQTYPFLFNFPFDSSVVNWAPQNLQYRAVNPSFGIDRFGGGGKGLWLKNDSSLNSYVDISNQIILANTYPCSYTLYLKPSATVRDSQMVLLDKEFSNGGWKIVLDKNGSTHFSISIKTQTSSHLISSSVTNGAWNHLFLTLDTLNNQLSITAGLNSLYNYSTTNVPKLCNNGDTLRLGGSLTDTTNAYSGLIDHFRACATTYIEEYVYSADRYTTISTTNLCRNTPYTISTAQSVGLQLTGGNFQEFFAYFYTMSGGLSSKASLASGSFILGSGTGAGQLKIGFAMEDPLHTQSIAVDSAVVVTIGPNTLPVPYIVVGNTLTVQITGTSYTWYQFANISGPEWIQVGTGPSLTIGPLQTYFDNDYMCIVTQLNGCPMSTGTIYQPYDPNYVGTKSLASNQKLYPNPSQGSTTLETTAPIDYYEILSLEGKTIERKVAYTGSYRESIGTSHLPKGIYLLRVQTSENVQTMRLVVE